MLIGTLGLIGSGKGTVADELVRRYGFRQDSFASTLKDVCAVLFNWDRNMLEGATPASRAGREIVDQWWSKQLGIPNFTPRLALQLVGTEVFRNHFHKDIWMLSVMARYNQGQRVVVSDARFPNEIQAIRDAGGVIVRVSRGELPEWWNLGVKAATGDQAALQDLQANYRIHESEWAWSATEPDFVITNDGSLDDLYTQVEQFAQKIGL